MKLAKHWRVGTFLTMLNVVLLVGVSKPSFGYSLNLFVTGPGGITATAFGYGNQTCYDNCSYSYAYNTAVTLTHTAPPVDYSFVNWGSDCSGNGSCEVTITGEKNVTATFADITPPDTIISAGYSSPALSSPALFGFVFYAPNESGCTFECNLNGENWAPCTSQYSNSFFYPICTNCHTETPMSFSVRAKDQVGNYDPTPATYSWTIYHPLNDPIDNVQDGGEIQLLTTDINADLTFSRATTITLKGGYSSDYLTQLGVTSIHGLLTIEAGTVIIENIVIAP